MAEDSHGSAGHTALLLDLGRRLAASLDYEETGRAIVEQVVPHLADAATIVAVEPKGLRVLASHSRDAALKSLMDEYLARFPVSLDDPAGAGAAIRTGRSQLYAALTPEALDELARGAEHREILQRLSPRSAVIVPLRARAGIVGALSLVRAGASPGFTDDDLRVAEDVASRAALALENASLFRAERAAREDAERMRRLLEAQNEAAPDGIFFQAANGTTAWYNQRLLRMWDVDSSVPARATLQERLAAVMDRLEDPQGFAKIALDLESRPDEVRRFDVRSKSGKTFDCYTSPVRDGENKLLGRVWYYRDVTTHRAMEGELASTRLQLQQNEKLALIGTLVSGVAHEIRTPLAYVNNHAHLMQRWVEAARARGPGNLDALDTSARSITEGVDRMNRLVVELRRFIRKDEPLPAPTDVDDAVRGAVNLFTATHRGRAHLEAAFGNAGTALVDKTQLQQVVLNLLENAVESSPPGAPVHIETHASPNGPVLVVRDHGPGIPEDVRGRMWEPFFTTKKEGTGLGLSIVRRIVEAADGSVECESEAGKGATFTIRLPAAPRA